MKRYVPVLYGCVERPDGDYILFTDHEAAIKQAVAAEREACAVIAKVECVGGMDLCIPCNIADAIRQRGRK